MKVCSFLFGSPVSASDISKAIFYIKATEDNTNIPTPMLSISVKNVTSFGSLNARPCKLHQYGFRIVEVGLKGKGLLRCLDG